MNRYSHGSFPWPCPALNAGRLSYVRWSFFHAESSILKVCRSDQPLPAATHSCRATDLVSTRYLVQPA
jgi:hypothetical protein